MGDVDVNEAMSVFDKMHKAQQQGRGVTLTYAELELLYELVGDALGKAESELERWRSILEQFQRSSEDDGDE